MLVMLVVEVVLIVVVLVVQVSIKSSSETNYITVFGWLNEVLALKFKCVSKVKGFLWQQA